MRIVMLFQLFFLSSLGRYDLSCHELEPDQFNSGLWNVSGFHDWCDVRSVVILLLLVLKKINSSIIP